MNILFGNQKTKKYTETLRDYLLSFDSSMHPTTFIFKQDDDSIHTSRETTGCFRSNKVKIMHWAGKRSDLNPIENIGRVHAILVYANMRQYHSLEDLKACIVDEFTHLHASAGSLKVRPVVAVKLCSV